jgi:ABC-type Na+ transport system ATPase subunit NatA
MKMNKFLIATFILIIANFIYGQNVGIGTTDPKAKLDVAGDLILQSAELILADGNTLGLDITTQKYNHNKLRWAIFNFQN